MSSSRSRFVAATTRTSTGIAPVPPTGIASRSCNTRSSLTCVAGDISPISSRKKVPPRAAANNPCLSRTAPVNEPFTWPNSSDSSRLSGSAPQFSDRKGPSLRPESSWMKCAMTSFPVPDSPWMSTVLSVGATCSASRSTSRNGRALPSGLTSPERSRRRISCFSCLFSALSRRCSAARRQMATRSSFENGFWM